MTDKRLTRLLPVARWPSAQEAGLAKWFSPVQIGPVTAVNRTWVPAMVPWRATGDGLVTPGVLQWYERFAAGEPGVVVVEATGIREVPSGPLLRAGHDRFIEGLSALTRVVRQASGGRTKCFIQLIDFLAIKRRPAKEVFFARHLELTEAHRAHWPGAVAAEIRLALAAMPDEKLREVLNGREFEAYSRGLRERVTDMHLPHIEGLPRALPPLFAAAAKRCEAAGFDGIELHFAHAYTMASFLSAKNDRTDGYGGPLDHRVRLPIEVFEATRAAVSKPMAVGCRFLADEIIDGGSHVDDAVSFGVAFAKAGMDFLSLSRGGKFEDARPPKVGQAIYPYTGVSGHECMPTPMVAAPGPWGRNVPAVARVKRAVSDSGFAHLPIVACGGISSFWQAEEILQEGSADIVASARQSIADPDWFLKIRSGRGDEIRRCFFTNYCEGLDQSHEAVTCQRWDRLRGLADDEVVARTHDGRRMVAPAWK